MNVRTFEVLHNWPRQQGRVVLNNSETLQDGVRRTPFVAQMTVSILSEKRRLVASDIPYQNGKSFPFLLT